MNSNIQKEINSTGGLSRRLFLGGSAAMVSFATTRIESWLSHDYSQFGLDQLFSAFTQSLNPIQKQQIVLPADHPMRQVTLTQATFNGPHIGSLFNWQQIELLRAIYSKLLSEQGQAWLANTVSLEGLFEAALVRIYSSAPSRMTLRNSQIVLNGGHFLLRSQDIAGSGYALGGPVSYGQQIGNNRFKVQGNAFKAHGDAVDQLHNTLNQAERLKAYRAVTPNELNLQLRGAAKRTNNRLADGLNIGQASEAAQEVAAETIKTLLSGFSASHQNDAWAAIENNGGISELSLSLCQDYGFYANGERFSELSQTQKNTLGLPYFQVWRIEGPALTIHFQGYPHVHAYMNIANDVSKTAIGETLGETQIGLSESQVQSMMMAVLRNNTGADFAFMPAQFSYRLSPGVISTGSIHALDPFGNTIVVAEVDERTMSAELRDSLKRQGAPLKTGGKLRIATIDYMLQRPDLFAPSETVETSENRLRDALIDLIRSEGVDQRYV